MRALIERINRKFWPRRERLRTSRRRDDGEIGDFYVTHEECAGGWHGSNVVLTHVDPVELARELGVLRAGERLAGPRCPVMLVSPSTEVTR